jgi:hypothetical protein
MSVAALYQRCHVSELKIYEALEMLVTSNHFEVCGVDDAHRAQVA